jgi:hypothetical protein
MVAPKKEEPITTDAPGSEALPRVSTKHVFRECARLSPAILAHFLHRHSRRRFIPRLDR